MTVQDLGSLGEFVAAIATVATLAYLALQIRASNRLARAEAARGRTSEMSRLNAAFALDPAFRAVFRRVLAGASRDEIDPDDRTLMDFYLVSATNVAEQLAVEVREGVFASRGERSSSQPIFTSPYYRSSWPIYRVLFSKSFVEQFERTNGLDPSVEANW